MRTVIEEMSIQVAKCNMVQQENIVVNETLTAELERYKEQVKLFEQRQKFDLNDREKYIDGQLRQVIVDRNVKVADFEKQIHSLKLQLNVIVESHKTLSTTVECLKKESKQKEDKYLNKVIDLQNKNKFLDNVVYKMGQSTQTMHMLTKPQDFYNESHKTALGYQNPFNLSQARRKVPALYDGHTIVRAHDSLFVTDTDETLELAEESRLKMLAKQNYPNLKEKKFNIAPVDYVALNKLSEHFVKHFVPQKQLSAEQIFWLPISQPVSEKPPVTSEPVLKKEIPRELPPISLVKDSFQKMKEHVNKFDETITFHTKITGTRIGSWGVEHIQEAFEKDVKPFSQTLKEYFQLFEHDKKYFEIEKKELSLDNDRLLEHIICQDVIDVVMHVNVHNVLSVNTNCLDNDNIALESLKMENDRLIELLISQDLVHTIVNTLATIHDYKSMQQSFVDEYNETLVLKAELAKKHDMIEKAITMNFQNDVPITKIGVFLLKSNCNKVKIVFKITDHLIIKILLNLRNFS
ncbi:hypothetical protein Tco_1381462 [Tanacetum coccineum]